MHTCMCMYNVHVHVPMCIYMYMYMADVCTCDSREKVCYTLLMTANKPETAVQGCAFFSPVHVLLSCMCVYVSPLSSM